MFSIVIIVAVIALLVVGPEKLPDLAKTLGKGLSEFKKATAGITDDLKDTLKGDNQQDPDSLKHPYLLKKAAEEKAKSNLANNEANK